MEDRVFLMKATSRIVHVIESCGPGGAECLVKSLLLEMKRQGGDVALWVLTAMAQIDPTNHSKMSFEGRFILDLRRNGIPVEIIGKSPHKDWCQADRKLRALSRRYGPAIIHTHLESVSFHVVRSMCFARSRLIQTVHNTKVQHPWIVRYLFSRAFSGFVAISKRVKDIALGVGVPACKIHTIYNGIHLSTFAFPDREIRTRAVSLVAIGRLTEQKGHRTLISAVRLLKERYYAELQPFPKITIIGDGELKGTLQQAIRQEGVEQDIRLEGVRDDIPKVLRKHDVYVMPSNWEGLSISLLEAMASGIPVVATDTGSNSEVVDHEENGLIVPVSSPEALSEGMYRLLKDRALRQRFSQSGPEKASQFSIEECARKHLHLYQRVSFV